MDPDRARELLARLATLVEQALVPGSAGPGGLARGLPARHARDGLRAGGAAPGESGLEGSGFLATSLDALAEVDAPLAQLVDLHFFGGFSFAELAELRGISERTVLRDWRKARLLLHRVMQDAG